MSYAGLHQHLACSDSCPFPQMHLVKAKEAFQEQASLKIATKDLHVVIGLCVKCPATKTTMLFDIFSYYN